ncbi:unnamed protein product [Taenia asiatica]|uniref:MMS1_N domain-containing protein n=1 Tax=Taenia asiatica TaxID=60517 RepID=A0A0R3WD29_TAEAS|nr:unnamed protein product [Taenia asiatica]
MHGIVVAGLLDVDLAATFSSGNEDLRQGPMERFTRVYIQSISPVEMPHSPPLARANIQIAKTGHKALEMIACSRHPLRLFRISIQDE